MLDHQRAPLAHRQPDGVVGLQVAKIVDAQAQAAAAGGAELRTELEIARVRV
jgi:hypothetical protein